MVNHVGFEGTLTYRDFSIPANAKMRYLPFIPPKPYNYHARRSWYRQHIHYRPWKTDRTMISLHKFDFSKLPLFGR